MWELCEQLLEGQQKDIALALLERKGEHITDSDTRIESIMVFLEPLFCDKYVESMKVKDFRLLLKHIFEDADISVELKKSTYRQPFHFKLVLNILGFLSKNNNKFNSKVKTPP